MSSILNWNSPLTATPSLFKVYRSIDGVKIPFPNSIAVGDVLLFSATSPTIQRVTFSTVDIDSFVSQINAQAKGLQATKATDSSGVYLRCTNPDGGTLKLYACTACTHLSIATPALFTPTGNFTLLASVPFVTSVFAYTYTDVDGTPSDWYRISTVTAGVESLPTVPQQALPPGSFCTISGQIVDLQGNAVSGAAIKAYLMLQPGVSGTQSVSFDEVRTETDPYGRWVLSLPQTQLVVLQIDATGYNNVVQIPALSYAQFTDLVPVNDYYFNPAGEITP